MARKMYESAKITNDPQTGKERAVRVQVPVDYNIESGAGSLVPLKGDTYEDQLAAFDNLRKRVLGKRALPKGHIYNSHEDL